MELFRATKRSKPVGYLSSMSLRGSDAVSVVKSVTQSANASAERKLSTDSFTVKSSLQPKNAFGQPFAGRGIALNDQATSRRATLFISAAARPGGGKPRPVPVSAWAPRLRKCLRMKLKYGEDNFC